MKPSIAAGLALQVVDSSCVPCMFGTRTNAVLAAWDAFARMYAGLGLGGTPPPSQPVLAGFSEPLPASLRASVPPSLAASISRLLAVS